jgi:hypothetical protein
MRSKVDSIAAVLYSKLAGGQAALAAGRWPDRGWTRAFGSPVLSID